MESGWVKKLFWTNNPIWGGGGICVSLQKKILWTKRKLQNIFMNNKNTNSKIEFQLSSSIDQMTRTKSEKPQMTEEQRQTFQDQKQQIDNYEASKKLQAKYTTLRVNLESIRESKIDHNDNEKNQQAIDHFEIMEQTILKKIENYKQSAEKQIQQIKDNLEKSLDTINGKLQFVQLKLRNARERKTKVKKTKEEIKVEKQIQELFLEFKKINPDRDLEFYFPNHKAYLPSTTTINSETQSLPPPPLQKNPIVQPTVKEEEQEEDEMEAWSKMTPWERFVKSNPNKSQYKLYHEAIEMGITPDIDEPAQPIPKRVPKTSTHQTKTMSRESLAKIIPGYN